MSITHESTSRPIQVLLRPGYWLAHTADGRMIACCEEPGQLDREVQRAGVNPSDVQLLQLPDQNAGISLLPHITRVVL